VTHWTTDSDDGTEPDDDDRDIENDEDEDNESSKPATRPKRYDDEDREWK
jgi:hypothetical protein